MFEFSEAALPISGVLSIATSEPTINGLIQTPNSPAHRLAGEFAT